MAHQERCRAGRSSTWLQILALSRNSAATRRVLESLRGGRGDGSHGTLGPGEVDRAAEAGHQTLAEKLLDELNRHEAETPPPLDCLQTECFRSDGCARQSQPLDFFIPSRLKAAADKVPERWLAGGIALSLQMPWEEERKTRLWRLVWAGLFRNVETPRWQLPELAAAPRVEKEATLQILRGTVERSGMPFPSWLALPEGPGASVTPGQLARLLDASWLSDERLFCSVTRASAQPPIGGVGR